MKLYFAAPFALGPYVSQVQERVVEIGHEVTSRWVDYATGSPDSLHLLSCGKRAQLLDENDSDVARADALVAIVIAGHGKEMFCEAALARMLDKPVLWVGNESLMPLSAFRPGARVLEDTSALYEVMRDLVGDDGAERLRRAMLTV